MNPLETPRIYCFGMVAPSSLLLLDTPYPAANAYAEIRECLENIAGEAVAGAWVLQGLGMQTQIDGRWLADSDQARLLLQRLQHAGMDTSRLQIKPGFHPMEEVVIADGVTRTVFGGYIKILFTEIQWNFPCEEDIAQSSIALIDPFLGEASHQCAQLCTKHAVPFVTCDVEPTNPIAQNALATIISEEFLLREGQKLLAERYPGASESAWEQIFTQYTQHCNGWIIFTFGGEPIWYREPGSSAVHKWKPRTVQLRDSTGAGDSFRAGFAYAMLQGLQGESAISTASAVAELVCERFPGVLQSPSKDELNTYLAARPAST